MVGENGETRAEALRRIGLPDEMHPPFERIARGAATALGTRWAVISLLGEDKQWFLGRFGVEETDAPLTTSFCTHAVRGSDVMVVEDATRDDRFARNPLVTGDPHIRFYAGAPLKLANGQRVGTLCAFDDKPRDRPPTEQIRTLEILAARAVEEMEARRKAGGER